MTLDLVYGRPTPAWLTGETYVAYVEMAERMPTAYREVMKYLKKAAQRRKNEYDRVRPAVFKTLSRTRKSDTFHLEGTKALVRNWKRCTLVLSPFYVNSGL